MILKYNKKVWITIYNIYTNLMELQPKRKNYIKFIRNDCLYSKKKNSTHYFITLR